MTKQRADTRITQDDAETLEERRINSLPPALQTLAVAHHSDQWDAGPSLVGQQAANFVLFCNTLGIEAQK